MYSQVYASGVKKYYFQPLTVYAESFFIDVGLQNQSVSTKITG